MHASPDILIFAHMFCLENCVTKFGKVWILKDSSVSAHVWFQEMQIRQVCLKMGTELNLCPILFLKKPEMNLKDQTVLSVITLCLLNAAAATTLSAVFQDDISCSKMMC